MNGLKKFCRKEESAEFMKSRNSKIKSKNIRKSSMQRYQYMYRTFILVLYNRQNDLI